MMKVSRSFALSAQQDGVSYYIEWEDINGTTTNIPCDSSGVGKVVNTSSGANAWITAKLYKREGESAGSLFAPYSVTMHCYDINGNEIRQFGYPSTNYNQSYYTIQTYDYTWGARAKYVAEFKDSSGNVLATSAICRNLDGEKGADGVTASRYNDEYFAWSNVSSVSSVDTEPSPNSGWYQTIQPQGTYAYLWKKIVAHVLNTTTGQYSNETPQYFRMTGEQGTQVKTKGTVQGVVDSFSQLPASANDGDKFIVQGETDFAMWDSSMNEWLWDSGSAVSGDAFTISSNCTYKGENVKGHLFQLNYESNHLWVDLGQFTGQDGITYYSHIAWATGVYYDSQGDVTSVDGFVITKQANDTTHLWMGVLVDTNSGQDPSNALLYTWSYTKGANGDRGKTGRFYYYGGVFNPNDSTTLFEANDTEIPFFKDHNAQNSYHLYEPDTNPSGGHTTMAQMWADSSQSFNNAPFVALHTQWKYLMTQAIFSDFALLGSFVISGDWMISQQGVNNSTNPKTPAYRDFTVDNNGHIDESRFVPNFAVNGATGSTYQQKAYVNGQINVKSLKTSFYQVDGSSSSSSAPVSIPLSNNPVGTYRIRNKVKLPNASDFLGLQINLFFDQATLYCYEYDGANYGNVLFNGYDTTNPTPIGLNLTPYSIYCASGILTLIATNTFTPNYTQWVVVAQRGIMSGYYMSTNYRIYPDGHFVEIT